MFSPDQQVKMPTGTSYAPVCPAEPREPGKQLGMDGKTQHPKLGLNSLKGKAFIYFITYSWGGEGVPSELACLLCEASPRAHAGSRLPGREAARLRCLPWTPCLGLLAEQKEQLHPGKQIAFLRPIDFLIF